MITITFDESSEAGRTLINVARALKQSVKNAMIHIDDEKEEMTDKEMRTISDSIPFQRIPGLPYTHEERMESLRKAEEDIAAGRVYTHEEVMRKMREEMTVAEKDEIKEI